MYPSEAQLRNMIDTIPALAWCCFTDGTTEFLNRRWLEYTGLSQEEAAGWGWQRPVHPEDLGKLMDTWRALLASGKPGEEAARLRRFDGEYRWFLFRAQPFRDQDGRVVRWYGTNVDIEELKRAEKELRDLVDYVPQLIVILGPAGRRVHANRVTLDYFGRTLEGLQRAADFDRTVIHPEDFQKMQSLREKLSQGEPFEFETRMRGKEGVYRWFLFRYYPLRDCDGRVLRWYTTATEIEDQKRAEESIKNENLALREEVDKVSMFEEIVGSSSVLQSVLSRVGKVAPVCRQNLLDKLAT
jgi:formate hydrogenlyase transcriptional activator